jgi:hypothetical protein
MKPTWSRIPAHRPYTQWSLETLRCFCFSIYQGYLTNDISKLHLNVILPHAPTNYTGLRTSISAQKHSVFICGRTRASNEAIKATALSIPLNDWASPKIWFNTCSIIEMVSLSLSGGCNVGWIRLPLPLLLLYDPNSQVIIRLAALWRGIDCCNERKLKLIHTHTHTMPITSLCTTAG